MAPTAPAVDDRNPALPSGPKTQTVLQGIGLLLRRPLGGLAPPMAWGGGHLNPKP